MMSKVWFGLGIPPLLFGWLVGTASGPDLFANSATAAISFILSLGIFALSYRSAQGSFRETVSIFIALAGIGVLYAALSLPGRWDDRGPENPYVIFPELGSSPGSNGQTPESE